MKDRIIQFLKENNLTSTKFADTIGVQRSSISHILSGRNKPSFDFIEKMLKAYPRIDAQWLITGKGQMNIDQTSLFTEPNLLNSGNITTQQESNISGYTNFERAMSKPESVKNDSEETKENEIHHEKKIERVMIFYLDGTFKEYKSL